ncbi:MAG: hypothetical protein H5U10_02180 [Desulfacinum sp.]|jgi:hypothetical protein|nr:hypothetical protein [Desulfacinum sp.]
MDRRLLKELFWDYDVDRLHLLPGITYAQRIVDLWPLVEYAHRDGTLSTEDFLALVERIADYVDEVHYGEGVREIVIKELVKACRSRSIQTAS